MLNICASHGIVLHRFTVSSFSSISLWSTMASEESLEITDAGPTVLHHWRHSQATKRIWQDAQ